jgi:predicted protein tyrosine phosphatase
MDTFAKMSRAMAPHAREVRKILFVCHLNRVRSATAERLFCKRSDLDVRSAGTSSDAMVQVNARMLEWADMVITMDDSQRLALEQMFPQHAALARLVCLQIADEYTFLQPELVALLEARVAPLVPLSQPNSR